MVTYLAVFEIQMAHTKMYNQRQAGGAQSGEGWGQGFVDASGAVGVFTATVRVRISVRDRASGHD